MQDLFRQLFNRNMDEAESKTLLMNITKEYPYFSAAQFYLLKKTEQTDPAYDRVSAKTALHFNNPFLLNYRINETISDKKIEIAPEVKAEVQESVEPKEMEVKPEIQINVTRIPEVKEIKLEGNVDDMIFEPLFATDYFASQGIKLSEEVQPGDKLGRQLKSFTEWLKDMKKVHEIKATGENIQIDLAVQNLAEKSNQETDILTESMAEAYLQQGKLKKARETLEKLSLLNPAKSAYFAAKIESIDHQ